MIKQKNVNITFKLHEDELEIRNKICNYINDYLKQQFLNNITNTTTQDSILLLHILSLKIENELYINAKNFIKYQNLVNLKLRIQNIILEIFSKRNNTHTINIDIGFVIKDYQQRLLYLRHASICQLNNCHVINNCNLTKSLWHHIVRCKSLNCNNSYCESSRNILNHFLKCNDILCTICMPVKQSINIENELNNKNKIVINQIDNNKDRNRKILNKYNKEFELNDNLGIKILNQIDNTILKQKNEIKKMKYNYRYFELGKDGEPLLGTDGLPIPKSIIVKAVNYELDENGNQTLNEDGHPILLKNKRGRKKIIKTDENGTIISSSPPKLTSLTPSISKTIVKFELDGIKEEVFDDENIEIGKKRKQMLN
jgi:hypothetical protein